jgi:hypothetical protein
MKGPGIFTLLMLMTFVVGAYAVASPRASAREGGLFGRSTAAKYSCPLGSHYSSFYGECTRTVLRVSH